MHEERAERQADAKRHLVTETNAFHDVPQRPAHHPPERRETNQPQISQDLQVQVVRLDTLVPPFQSKLRTGGLLLNLDLLIEIIRLSLWLMGLVVLFVPLERVFAVHPHKIFRKGIVADLGYYFLSRLLPAVLLSVPVSVLAWVTHQVVPGAFLAKTAALPLWARVLAGFEGALA